MEKATPHPVWSLGFLQNSILSPVALVVITWITLDRAALLVPLTGADWATFIAFFSLTLLMLATWRSVGFKKQEFDLTRQALIFSTALVSGWALGPGISFAVARLALELDWPTPWPLTTNPLRLASTLLLAPIFEEILYRERLFMWLNAKSSTVTALALSSLAFALPHPGPVSRSAALAAGLILASTRLMAGRWLPCLGCHIGLNLFGQFPSTTFFPTSIHTNHGIMIGVSTLALSIYLCRQEARRAS